MLSDAAWCLSRKRKYRAIVNITECKNMADYSFHEQVGFICTYGRTVGNRHVTSRP